MIYELEDGVLKQVSENKSFQTVSLTSIYQQKN